MHTRKRSIVKAISWQIIGFFVTLAIVYYFTGQFIPSLKITVIGMIAGSIVFYLHERVWNQISWGKN